MAKKLTWGRFSTDDLVVDQQDDIYELFPFLNLVGMLMVKINEFRINDNAVRGIKDTVNQKLVGLSGSLFYGWDRTSWPIPFMEFDNAKEAFDRRHTLKVCRDLQVNEVPAANYKRIRPENGGVFNDFLDKSILTIAAMWGNVYGPIVEDTKDYMFEKACVRIIKDERERDDFSHQDDLLTRPFVRSLLKHMGCYQRYNNNTSVVERIVTKTLDSLVNPKDYSDAITINNNVEDVDRFIENSDDWQEDNTYDDKYCYILRTIEDSDSFCHTYAERILTRVCKNEKEYPTKKTKVLIYNKQNSKNAEKIVKSRNKLKNRLNSGWQLRRDNVLLPVERILNKDIVPTKTLSDLKMEIWLMNQLEGEDEPFEISIDDEEMDI